LHEIAGRENDIRADGIGHRMVDDCAECVVGFDATHSAFRIGVQMRIGDMKQS
jgi:hypothetical protein